MFSRLLTDYGWPITADEPALHAWLSDAEFVDVAVPLPEARVLVFDTVEVDAIAALTARLRTPHQEN